MAKVQGLEQTLFPEGICKYLSHELWDLNSNGTTGSGNYKSKSMKGLWWQQKGIGLS